jgi:hypothetical protein
VRIEWKGGKLTKLRALFLCYKLWEWLAENPGKMKEHWLGWEINGGKVKGMFSECPCCAYSKKAGCEDCLLLELWPSGCLKKKSPFVGWIRAQTPRSRKKYAAIIRDAAKTEYLKMETYIKLGGKL